MKITIITRIEGVKQYVRRIRHGKHGASVSMLTTNKDKAMVKRVNTSPIARPKAGN